MRRVRGLAEDGRRAAAEQWPQVCGRAYVKAMQGSMDCVDALRVDGEWQEIKKKVLVPTRKSAIQRVWKAKCRDVNVGTNSGRTTVCVCVLLN